MDRLNMDEFMQSFEDDWQRSDRPQRPMAESDIMKSPFHPDHSGMMFTDPAHHNISRPAQPPFRTKPGSSLEGLDIFDFLEPMGPDHLDETTADQSYPAMRGGNAAFGAPYNERQPPNRGFASNASPHMNMSGDPMPYGYNAPNIRVDPVINVVEPEEPSNGAMNYVDEAFPMYSAAGVPLKGAHAPMFQTVKDEFTNGSHDSSPSTSPHINVHGSYTSPHGMSHASPHTSPLMTTDFHPPGTPHSAGSPLESPLASPLIGSPISGFEGHHSSSFSASHDMASPMVDDSIPFDNAYQRLDVPLRHSRALSDTWGDRERTAFLDTLAAQTQGNEHPVEFPQIRVHNASPNLGQPVQLGVPQTRHRSHSSPYEPTNDLKGGQMFACELCDKRFTRAYNLRSHMRTHTDERPFACKHCGKAFARQHDRKRHEALHSGEKRFVCRGEYNDLAWGCKKRFARADALGRHFRTEAGKACLRPLIDRIFANGGKKESAPEGILFTGIVDGEPQVALTGSKDGGQKNEREDHTRRTVIVTAVAEQLQGILTNGSAQLPSDSAIRSGA